MSMSARVVFLANDAVFVQGLAFLESFRASNPSMQLSMIPFADDIEKFRSIQDMYSFDILDVDTERWDALAREFFPGAERKFLHRLRKLSIFEAATDVTIYLDLDMVVLSALDFLIEPIARGDFDFICTSTANDPWVYNKSYMDNPQLRHALRFSDGFFAFNSNKISADLAYKTIVDHKEAYLSVRADLVYCQPVTNFIVDMLELKVGEVFNIFPDVSPQVWYGAEELTFSDGRVFSRDGKEVLFVHWAGPVDMAKDFRLRDLFETYLESARCRTAAAGIELAAP